MVCRLKKALYGLKQAPRNWYARLEMYFSKLGFIKGTTNGNLYLRKIDDGLFIIVIFLYDKYLEEMIMKVISLLKR